MRENGVSIICAEWRFRIVIVSDEQAQLTSSHTILLLALDEAAVHLLKKAGVNSNVEGEPASIESPLVEQVKAFSAILDYVKMRRELAPVEKKQAVFDGLRTKFNGTDTGRRTRRAAKEASSGVAAEPVNVSANGSGTTLFDA